MQEVITGKWLKVSSLFSVAALLLLISGCGGSSQSEPVFNISGSWFLYHTTAGTPGEQGPDLFTFTQTDNSLSGTTSLNQQITGSVSDVNVTFSWTGSDGAANNYSGTVSSNGTMSGTWTSSKGKSGTWHAIINTAPSANITGNWNIFHTTAGTPGEQGPDLFTFVQSGNGLTGTTPLNQQIIGSVSSLTVTFSWAGSDGATNVYTGAIVADGMSMSGTWMSTGGQSGTWRSTKSS